MPWLQIAMLVYKIIKILVDKGVLDAGKAAEIIRGILSEIRSDGGLFGQLEYDSQALIDDVLASDDEIMKGWSIAEIFELINKILPVLQEVLEIIFEQDDDEIMRRLQ